MEDKLKEIIEKNRDKEKPTYEIRTIGYEDRLSPEEEKELSNYYDWDDEW